MATTETGPRTPEGAWLDEGGPSPDWAPPAEAAGKRSRLRQPLVYGSVLLALALLVGLLQLAGGFDRRTDQLTPAAPGQLIATGPFELSFTEATVQPREDGDGRRTEWRLTVVGQARTTGDEAMSPTIHGSDGVFVLKDPASGQILTPDLADLGDRSESYAVHERQELTPGLPPIGYRLSFNLPPDFAPPPQVQLAVDELVLESTYLVSDEKSWDGTGFGWLLDLPVRVLPA